VEAGEAKGVVLDTDEEITASKAIVSNLHVKQLFLDLIRPEELTDGFPEKVRRIKQDNISPLMQVFALDESPKYKAGGDVNRAPNIIIVPSTEELLRSFDDCYYGVPIALSPAVVCNTLYDPTRAPEGKHTLGLYHLEPYSLKDGGAVRWDEIREEVADRVLGTVRQHATNIGTDNILGRWISTPLDFYRYNPAWIDGDYNHFPLTVTQSYGNRPLPGWGSFRTPVRKLYICGPSAHPGGGVWGGGRATAQVIMEDLDLDFRKVISR
jgi:phytoene dehydrogenase-like protein